MMPATEVTCHKKMTFTRQLKAVLCHCPDGLIKLPYPLDDGIIMDGNLVMVELMQGARKLGYWLMFVAMSTLRIRD